MTSYPSVSFQVEKIIDVVTVEGNVKNFKVQWAPSWVSSLNLFGCEKLIKDFLNQRCDEYKCGDNTFTFPMDFSIDRNINQTISPSIETGECSNNENMPMVMEQTLTVGSDVVTRSNIFKDTILRKDFIDSLPEVRVELPNVMEDLATSSISAEKELSANIVLNHQENVSDIEGSQNESESNPIDGAQSQGDPLNSMFSDSPNITEECNSVTVNGESQIGMEENIQDIGSKKRLSATIFEKLSNVLNSSMDDIEDSFRKKQTDPVKYIKSEEASSSTYQYLPKFQEDQSTLIIFKDSHQEIFTNTPNVLKSSMVNGESPHKEKDLANEKSGLKRSIEPVNGTEADNSIPEGSNSEEIVKSKCNFRHPEKRIRNSHQRKEYSIRGRSMATSINSDSDKQEIEKQSDVSSELTTEMHSIDCKNMCIEGKYKCIACGITFVNARNFSKHQCFSCSYCKMTFYDKSAFDEHVVAMHKPSESDIANSEVDDTLDCRYCGMSFSNKGRFKKHKCFCCTSCKMIFTTKLIFDKHLLSHSATGSSKRRRTSINTCSNCGLAFFQGKPFLKKHKCYPCKVCSEVFLTKQLFDEHLLHHANTVESDVSDDKETKRKFY